MKREQKMGAGNFKWDKISEIKQNFQFQQDSNICICTYLLFLNRELMEVFPDAKVILTIREPEAWYESVKNTIYKTKNIHQIFPMNMLIWMSGYYQNRKVVSKITTKPVRTAKKGINLSLIHI